MSSWAKPGVKCVCIADAVASINDLGFPKFKKGQVFTIAFIEFDEVYGLFLAFEESSPRNLGHIDGFRPLITQEDDVRLIKSLLVSDAGLMPAGVELVE